MKLNKLKFSTAGTLPPLHFPTSLDRGILPPGAGLQLSRGALRPALYPHAVRRKVNLEFTGEEKFYIHLFTFIFIFFTFI